MPRASQSPYPKQPSASRPNTGKASAPSSIKPDAPVANLKGYKGQVTANGSPIIQHKGKNYQIPQQGVSSLKASSSLSSVNSRWSPQQRKAAGNKIAALAAGTAVAKTRQKSFQNISLRGEPDSSRVQELSINHEQGGKTDLAEGLGGARYEKTTGRKLSRSKEAGADFIDPEVGPVSLKGPLVNKSTGQPAPILDEMIEGLARSVTKDARNNTYTKRIVVDMKGMSAAQRTRLQQLIDAELARNAARQSKEIVFIE